MIKSLIDYQMNEVYKICKCVKIIAWIILRRGYRNYNGLKKLNIKTSDNLCLLGNGSSLKGEKFDNIGNVDYMVVNRHVISDDYFVKKPRFYVLADPHFFRHPEGISMVDAIKEKTTWELYLFVPYANEVVKLLNKTIINTHVHTVFYNSYTVNTGIERFDKWIYMHNLGMPRVQNVMVAAITIAIFLGFKTISLYGVEHSWTKYLFVNDNNEVCLYNPHFYDKDEIKNKTVKEIQHQKSTTIGEVLHKYAYMFDSYHIVRKIALWNDVSVINKTPNSFIDAFDRKCQ